MLVVGRSLIDAGRFEIDTGAAVLHEMPATEIKKRNNAPNLLTTIMLVLKGAVVKDSAREKRTCERLSQENCEQTEQEDR